MTFKLKKHLITALIIIMTVCATAGVVFADTSKEIIEKEPLNVAQLSGLEYTVVDNSGSSKGSVNQNAIDGGAIYIGPAAARRYFENGISILAISKTQAATLTIPVSSDTVYTTFSVDYGLDGSNKTSATAKFLFYVNGEKHSEFNISSTDFHKKFEIDLDGVTEIKVEVFADANVCVSFGDPTFYEASPNAVSLLTQNVSLGGWPVPIQRNANLYGGSLKIGSKTYAHGFCVNSIASFDLVLDREYLLFTAEVGVDEGVAAGADAGSIVVRATALDENGNLLKTVETPVLFGYMPAYELKLVVSGAKKIRINVLDGGDGFANDMAVIAVPSLSMTVADSSAYLSDLKISEYSIGEGSLGIDETAEGNALSYIHGSNTLSFKKGLGLSLKKVDRNSYIADPQNKNNYSFVSYDISNLYAKYVEFTAVSHSASGAYVSVYADGNKLIEKEVSNIASGGMPVLIGTKLPENAQKLDVVLVAKDNLGGFVDLLNAQIFGQASGFKGEVVQNLSSENYPFGRDVTPFGGNLDLVGGKFVASGFSIMANTSITFNVDDLSADMFSSTIGLLKGQPGTLDFVVTTYDLSGSSKRHVIENVSEARAISVYTENNVKKITLSAEGEAGLVAIFGDCNFFASGYGDIERISDLEWTGSATAWGSINIDKDVMGYPINVNGTVYEKGISMHAFNESDKYAYVSISIPEGLGYTVFASHIGVSKDTVNNGTQGSVKFYVEGDGQILYASNLKRVSEDAQLVLVDITNVSSLTLKIDNGDGGYECDFAAWIDPVIAKATNYLTDFLRVDSPIENQSVATNDNNLFEVSGVLLGSQNTAQIYLNDLLVGDALADFKTGKFSKYISVNKSGRNTIKVQSGDMVKEVNLFIASERVENDSYTLSTDTTSVTVVPAKNGIILQEISRVGGHNWIDENSFIRFPDQIKLGGENGTPIQLDWQYNGHVRMQEEVVSLDIDIFKNDYVGDLITDTFTYIDASGKFVLKSVWSAQSDYVGPVKHGMELINNSGEDIYVTTADTLTVGLKNPQGTTLTNSYSYKGAIYQTSYGYRLDTVSDGYDMNVFSSTDYNNGYQIDAGYIPWVSLHAGNEGLNIGVIWSDCRVHVYGVGDSAYVEAGLRPRFCTVIPSGDSYVIPESFIDAYGGSIDDGSNQLKEYLFAFSMPEVNRVDDTLPTYSYNLWELLDTERRSWRMSDEKFYTGVHQLAEAGIDEITIDTYWWKDVGDWRGVHEKWQSTMTYSSNYVNALGMDLSIYMQAGNGNSLHTDALTGGGIAGNNNWFATGENKSWDELCFGDPDAYEYVSAYLKNYFMESGLDGIRTDFSYILGYCSKDGHQHVDARADVGYWTSRNVYALFEDMYEYFPYATDVNSANSEVHYFKWENCNCGGTLKDFASMSYATRIQTTDAYDPINVRRSFYDASYVFPSMQLLLWMNDYMYNPDGPYSNNYRFWSCLMGSPCQMTSMPSDMPPEMYNSFVRTIEIYHDWMQDLVKYGDLYHILPRADGVNWDGVQYYNEDTGKGAVLTFKPDPNGNVEDTVTLKFQGLKADKKYYVWSELGYIPFATYTGAQLASGLNLTLEGSYATEIIYYMDCDAEGAAQVVEKPSSMQATLNIEKGRLAIDLTLAERAEYYLFEIETLAGIPVYNFMVQEINAKNNLIEGLKAGDYVLTVTAINRFGSSDVQLQFNVAEGSAFANDGLEISGAENGEVVIDGVRFIGGQTVDLSDSSFGISTLKTLNVSGLNGREYLNMRLALANGDIAEKVKVTVIGMPGEVILEVQEVDASDKFVDLKTLVAGYESAKIKVENLSPDVYIQSATGYGRTGLYGGKLQSNYDFTFDLKVLQNGLNETFPRAGAFAGYVNDNNFAAIYIDAYYSNIVIYERLGGQSSDKTTNIKMPKDFDYFANHTIRIVRAGKTFTYYVDGEIISTRSFALGASKVALITEDAQARFSNVSRLIGGTEEKISWSKYEVGVNIYGKTIYSTKVTVGDWQRAKPKLMLVAY